MKIESLTIRQVQDEQPWTVPYSEGVNEAERNGVPHILASHACLHAAKSVGKLSAVFEARDHHDYFEPIERQKQLITIKAMSADLFTIALRMANLYGFDLATELVKRVREKNGPDSHGEVRLP